VKVLLNELVEERDSLTQKKKKPIAKGFFKIKKINGTCALKLKGDFNSKNSKVIHHAMSMTHASHRKCIEIDMSAVDTIDMRAMALLIISLKTLKENGIQTKITGLAEENRKLANTLGMHWVADVH
jgi:anti-anti-sigma factor